MLQSFKLKEMIIEFHFQNMMPKKKWSIKKHKFSLSYKKMNKEIIESEKQKFHRYKDLFFKRMQILIVC